MRSGYIIMDIRLYRWESVIKQVPNGQVKYGQRGKEKQNQQYLSLNSKALSPET